jgi:hypothetical protein
VSCSTGPGNPEAVVQSFLDDLRTHNWAAAEEKSSIAMMQYVNRVEQVVRERKMTKDETGELVNPRKVECRVEEGEQQDPSAAECEVCCMNEQVAKFYARVKDGQWQIAKPDSFKALDFLVQGPEYVTKQFIKAYNNTDFREMKRFATKEAQSVLDVGLRMRESMGGGAKIPDKNKVNVDEVSCNVNYGAATCEVCCKADGSTENIDLKKVDGL